MSLEMWKAEFYPVDAKDVSEQDALDHSIRKWEGLRQEALDRHAVYADAFGDIVDRDTEFGSEFGINGKSCALCTHYLGDGGCERCPLVRVLGNPCDRDEESTFGRWRYNRNPEPMIAALKRAKES